MNENISKPELKLFNSLKEYIPDLKQQLSLGSYLFDIHHGKKIIEFNGDYWHANPEIYLFEDIVGNLLNNKPTYAYEVWAKDAKKKAFAESMGYDVMVVWESDYIQFPKSTIERCLSFLT